MSQNSKFNLNRLNNSNPSKRVMRNGDEKVDFPLRGKAHIVTTNHHIMMRTLKKNEIRFTVTDLLELLDDPSKGYQTKMLLNPPKKNVESQSYPQPRAPTGMGYIYIKRE